MPVLTKEQDDLRLAVFVDPCKWGKFVNYHKRSARVRAAGILSYQMDLRTGKNHCIVTGDQQDCDLCSEPACLNVI